MKRLRGFIPLFVSLVFLLVPQNFVNACGFEVAPGEYRFWLLQPDLTNERGLTPFFFASTYLYRQDEKGGVESYPRKNIDEWVEWMGARGTAMVRVSTGDIDSLLNHTLPRLVAEREDSLARVNSFVRWLRLRENAIAYRYIRLSKKVEQIAANPDPWEEGSARRRNFGGIIGEAEMLYKQAGSDFIRLRTAFQLMRLYSFNGNAGGVSKVYDERIAVVASASWVKSAAMYFKALRGECREADRLFAQVFDRGDYNKSYCLINMRWSNMDSLIRATPDAHQRVVLEAIAGFNYPGRSLGRIEKIFAAEPGYKEVPFLLLREINKVEDWLMTGELTGYKPAVHEAAYDWYWSDAWQKYGKANWVADRAYALRLNAFLLRVEKEGRAAQPALLRLFSAHLSMLLGDYTAAGTQLQAASAFRGLPRNVRSQIATNRFLLGLEVRKGLDPSLEVSLLRLLREPADRLGIYDAGIMKDQLILYTARKMIRWGDKVRGLMLLSRTRRAWGELPISQYKDVYEEIFETAGPADYDSMIAILDRGHKTPFERFVTHGKFGSSLEYYNYPDDWVTKVYWDRNRLLDGKARWYLRNNDLEAAADALRRIPDSFWRREPYKDLVGGNPFYLDVNKTGLYHGVRKVSYNKRTLVEKMIALKGIAGSDPARRAESHFLLANAWYNMTYWGSDWLMVKPWWSMNEMSIYSNGVERSGFNDFYFGCDRARDLYLQAMRETRDKKLAALCCFMAGLCDEHQKKYHSLMGHWDRLSAPRKDVAGTRNRYLAELRGKGVDAREYEEMVKECAVYLDYIRGFDRGL